MNTEERRATTVPLDDAESIDLLAVAGESGIAFVRGGTGFAGRGEALRGPRPAIVAALASMERDDPVDRPGSGPVAFGALPFLSDPDAEMVVPEVTVYRGEDGTGWVTQVAGATDDVDPVATLRALLAESGSPSPTNGPSSFTVAASRPPADWMQAVATATERIRAGQLDKVVLAREVIVTADDDLSVSTILSRLAQHYPGCYLYLLDGFCGASPELLVSRHHDVVRALPLAGTAPRRGDPDADSAITAALFSSATYRHEHQVTIDAVHDTLLAFASYVDYEPEPSIVALANVFHLATKVEGRLSHPPASVLELVDALHPTPAICGRPRDAALATIAELEQLDRGRYAGAIGWVDASGNGEWAVSIRGAEVTGPTARIIAGNGMVADSDPETELVETRAKLNAMLSAIIRP